MNDSFEFTSSISGKRVLPNCDCGKILRRGVVCDICGYASCYKCVKRWKGKRVHVGCKPITQHSERG